MATNFESVYHINQLAHPLLKASRKGSIVFMSSVSGFVSLKSMSVHGATKGVPILKGMQDFTAEEISRAQISNFVTIFANLHILFSKLQDQVALFLTLPPRVSCLWTMAVGSIYGATKGALNRLTRNLACEWAKDDIRSNSVAPWLIKTPLTETALSNEVFSEEATSRCPLGLV